METRLREDTPGETSKGRLLGPSGGQRRVEITALASGDCVIRRQLDPLDLTSSHRRDRSTRSILSFFKVGKAGHLNISLKIDHAPCTSDRLPEAKRSCSIILRVNYQSTRETARPRTRHGYLSPEFRKAGRGLGHRTGRLRTCGTSHDKVLVADVRTVGTSHHRTDRLSTHPERAIA